MDPPKPERRNPDLEMRDWSTIAGRVASSLASSSSGGNVGGWNAQKALTSLSVGVDRPFFDNQNIHYKGGKKKKVGIPSALARVFMS